MKIGRNEKCWCKSGKKYKRCHFNRDKRDPISKGDIIKATLNNVKYCSVPDYQKENCDGGIINAHTVSKSSSLKEIADTTNHVYGFKPNYINIEKNKGKIIPEKLGINKASTFNGFCSFHDKTIFASIEDQDFDSKKEQILALSYRSICKEVYVKIGLQNAVNLIKNSDAGTDLTNQILTQNIASNYEKGINASDDELKIIKTKIENKMWNNSDLKIKNLIIKSKTPCPVAVSSILSPDFDFSGNFLQDLSDLTKIPECITFNSFSSNGIGYVVFSWIVEDGVIDKFISTLPIDNLIQLKNTIIKFFFSASENLYFSPIWWDNLSDNIKNELLEIMMYGVNLFELKNKNYLKFDNSNIDGWDIDSYSFITF